MNAESDRDAVGITGIGIVSPFGHSADALAEHFCSAGGEPRSDCQRVDEIPLAAIPESKRTRIGRLDRLCRFFLAASYLATDNANLRLREDADASSPAPERVGLSFGTGLGCLLTDAEYNRKVVEQGPTGASPRLFAYTVSSAAAGEVSIALNIQGPNVTAHTGLAAGLGAVGYAYDLIRMNKADVVLSGGADVIGPDLLTALRDMGLLKPASRARPFQDAVPGLWPGEAAVVFVLERREHARGRSARVWGQIGGYGAGFEPTLTRHEPRCGGMTETIRRALAEAGRQPVDIDVIVASAHGTPSDDVERAALVEVFGRDAHAPVVLTPKAAFGDSFGASGVVALALAAGGFRRNARLPQGRAFDTAGQPRDDAATAARLGDCRLVLINDVCYSGPIVDLIFAREA